MVTYISYYQYFAITEMFFRLDILLKIKWKINNIFQ